MEAYYLVHTQRGGWHLPEDPEELVNFGVSVKQRLLGSKLSKDGASAPDIDRGGVPGRTQEDLGSSVPQGHHLENTVVFSNRQDQQRAEPRQSTATNPRHCHRQTAKVLAHISGAPLW